MKKINNIAFIDGQNLYMGTQLNDWKVDYKKLRVYLQNKYHVTEAYYHLGYVNDENQSLYNNLQKAGFIVSFRDHSSVLEAKKKGNVDTDIVFEVMKTVIERPDIHKVVIISGDGDYKRLVSYLVEKSKLEKILFPNKNFASSLYKSLPSKYYDYLDSIYKKIKH